MNKNFENDPRRQQEIRMRPVADMYYRQIFGENIDIARFEQEDDYILDKEFATDVKLTMPNGMILLGQEKFLSSYFARFETVTVEYEQNQWTGEQGDWYKLGVQFYFVGYCNQDNTDFSPWIMLNWPAVVCASHNGEIEWQQRANSNGSAMASFRYCNMTKFPEFTVISSSYSY